MPSMVTRPTLGSRSRETSPASVDGKFGSITGNKVSAWDLVTSLQAGFRKLRQHGLTRGANGKIPMGRRIVLGRDCPPGQSTCDAPQFVANNKVLVSVAQAFGIDVNQYGTTDDPAHSTGALPALG